MEWMVCHSDHKYQSSGTASCNISICWVWVIMNQWLWALLSLSMLKGGRQKSKQCQSSQDSFAHLALDAALIGSIAKEQGLLQRMVVMTVGRTGCMARKREWELKWDVMGVCYLWYAEKKDDRSSLCDNLCCKIASETRILLLLVVCGD